MSLLRRNSEFISFYFPIFRTLEDALQDYRVMATESNEDWWEHGYNKYIPVNIQHIQRDQALSLCCYKFEANKRMEIFDKSELRDFQPI